MGKQLVPKGGNDVVMTPPDLGKRIIEYFNPSGRVLEPCMGDGKGFYQHLFHKPHITPIGLELTLGTDFFDFKYKVDWIITNPPYSKLLSFVKHSFELSDNVVLLILLPNVFQSAKIRLSDKYRFGVKEIIYVDTPTNFPRFGFQLGVVHYQKGYIGDIKLTDWRK